MNTQRIVSLLPSATEVVCALGARSNLVGVSHCCDFPTSVQSLPRLTESIIDPALPAAQIDKLTTAALKRGESLYRLNEELLSELRPDIVITQALCDVCAISFSTVVRALNACAPHAKLVSLEPGSIEEVLGDVQRVGEALKLQKVASELILRAQTRLQTLQRRLKGATKPRVLALEWLDPLYFGGHWVPEQIEAAGGVSVIGRAHERSKRMTWQQVTELDPDVILVMPCGYDAQQSLLLIKDIEDRAEWRNLRAIKNGNVWALDANAYFSRPGPRIITGAELMGHILHPNLATLMDNSQEDKQERSRWMQYTLPDDWSERS